MANQDQAYRSLVMRKVQQLAKEHGGLAKIPRELQQRLGFDVIAKRKGTSISVTIPSGDLSSKIAQLQTDVPAAKAFGSSKPAPDPFSRYTPVASQTNQTMDDFWILQGWYKEDRIGMELIPAKWKDDEKVRAESVRFLVERVLKKDPRDITKEDFDSNRLSGLLNRYYNSSPYKALLEAGYQFHLWEMSKAPNGSYDSKENRVAATRWLVDKLGKDPRDIMQENFRSTRLRGLLSRCNESPYEALTEAGYQMQPWEMAVTPMGFYESKENRIAATRWLVDKLGKDPRDITKEDFNSNRLRGLLVEYYKDSPYAALLEAGYKFYPWEMKMTPTGVYDSKENRVAAIKWLVQKLKKDPRDITGEAFHTNRLGGLLVEYYKDGPYEALLEAGLVTPEDEAYMRSNRHTQQRN